MEDSHTGALTFIDFEYSGPSFRGGFRVQASGFRVQGSGSRDQGPGIRVQGAGLEP